MRSEPDFARSLVAWANACLRGEIALSRFDGWWHEARAVRCLSFHDGDETTHGAASWLDAQRAAGARRLALDARASPGAERVIVCGDAPLTAWRQDWTRVPGAVEAPWFDARYWRAAERPGALGESRAVAEVLAALRGALEGLVALGARADLMEWTSHFERALGVARGERDDGRSPLPPTAPLDAHRLARAANLADVFGGMGSWNDFCPLSDPELERERGHRSAALHDAVRAALAATAHA